MANELTIEWSDVNLEDFLPTDIIDLVESTLVPITDFISLSADALAASFELIKLTSGYIPPVVDPILAAIQATIALLSAQLNDLKNAGGSLMLIPPRPGGTTTFGNTLRSALANTRNPEVPIFSELAVVAAFGLLAYAPDSVAIRLPYDAIVSSVSVSDNIIRKLKIDVLVGTGKFESHDRNFKIAKSASPQPDTPWTTIQASYFIPKSGEIIETIIQYLGAVNTQIATNPLDDMIALANQTADQAAKIAADLQVTADFIESAFPNLPVKMFKVPPQSGGTASIAESSKDWFDTLQQTALIDVPSNAWTAGYIVVIGGPDFTQTQAIYDIWDDVFLP